MPMWRTTFDVKGRKVTAARLYVTARGIYELYLNGKRVGEDYYNPGLTQYNITHLYQTYDVTGMLEPGRNALGAMLGEGWWSGLLSFGNLWTENYRAALSQDQYIMKAGTQQFQPRSWFGVGGFQ
jgi:alpha-L-rhamnosidase